MRTGGRAARAWSAAEVRRAVAEHLRANTPRLADEMTDGIIARIPEYARPGDEANRRAVHRGVEHALRRFLEVLDGRGAGTDGWRGLYTEIGAIELREGRSMDAMHAAIRLCARIAWQHLIEDADRDAIPLRELGPLAATIFTFLDEIADASAKGYAQAKAAEAGEFDRRRRRLVTLLTASPPASAEAVTAAAAAAGWPLPHQLAAVVLDGSVALSPPPVLPPDILADFERAEPCLIVPHPEAGRQMRDLVSHLTGYRAAVGPPVGWAQAARSLRWAARALELARRGIIAADGVVWCRDHLSSMALFQDEDLLDALIERRLAPLAGCPRRQRDVLADTLLAWLPANGNANAVAAALHIHPQTARHRFRQLARLFGDALHDGEAMFELQIALRAERARRRADAS